MTPRARDQLAAFLDEVAPLIDEVRKRHGVRMILVALAREGEHAVLSDAPTPGAVYRALGEVARLGLEDVEAGDVVVTDCSSQAVRPGGEA